MEDLILVAALFPRLILSVSLILAGAASFGLWRFSMVRSDGGGIVIAAGFGQVFLALFWLCVFATVVLLSTQFSQLVRSDYLNLFT